jgi:hypothetical protein
MKRFSFAIITIFISSVLNAQSLTAPYEKNKNKFFINNEPSFLKKTYSRQREAAQLIDFIPIMMC